MALKIASLLNLLLAGVLVGNEFGSWAAVHPALGTLPPAAQVRSEQAITRRYGQMMPFLMIAAIVSCLPVLALARDRRSAAFRCPLAATFLFLGMLGITFAGNMPINRRLLQASPDAPPADWSELRGRWDRWHTLRNALNFTGFGLLCLSVLSPDKPDGGA